MTTAPISRSRRLLVGLPVAALAVGLVAGCTDDSGDAPAPGASASATATLDPTEHVAENLTEFSYAGEDGRTALELLQEHDPDAEVNGKGEDAFVVGIQGHEADQDSEFWALYVDGEMAQVGAGTLKTKDGQTITWKLEDFE